jgi:hypothetical protein
MNLNRNHESGVFATDEAFGCAELVNIWGTKLALMIGKLIQLFLLPLFLESVFFSKAFLDVADEIPS